MEKIGNLFDDGQLSLIDYNGSTGEIKWYFYAKISNNDSYNIIEGVAHTVLNDEPSLLSDDGFLEGGGGGTGGGAGGGQVQCRSCNGTGTYYATGQGIMKRCTDCNGRGSKTCTRSGCVGGSISCTDCGGDGIR